MLESQTSRPYQTAKCNHLGETLISSCNNCKFDRWMTEIQTRHLSHICLTSQQEMFLTGSVPRSILCVLRCFLSDQVTPFLKFTNYLPKVLYEKKKKRSFMESALTPRTPRPDLEVEVHHSSHPLWILVFHWSVHVLLSCPFPWEGHSGRQGCRRGVKENHALSAASWSNNLVLDSAPNVAEKPFGLFYMSSSITSQSFDKSSFWNKL